MVWVSTVRVQALMNSLFEIVLWGAPAVLLSWGLLLAFGCAAVFRDFPPREKPRRTGARA
jgi:hypothetical protein